MQTDKKTLFKRWGIVLAAVVLAWVLFNMTFVGEIVRSVVRIFTPLILGCFIAMIFDIPAEAIERLLLKIKWLSKKKVLVRAVSIVFSVIIVVGVIALVLLLVIPQVVNVITMLITNIPYYQEQINNILDGLEISGFSIDLNTIQEYIDLDSIKDSLVERIPSLLEASFKTASGAVGAIADFALAVVFALYLLAGKDKLKSQSKRFIRTFFKKRSETIIKVSRLTVTQFENFVSAQCTEAIILGTLVTLGLLVLGVPYAPAMGVVVGVCSLIPLIGATIGMIIGAIIIVAASPVKALVFIIYVIIIMQIEGNLIYPRVVGNKIGLPGIWVLVSIIIGGRLLGIPGILLGVPSCSVIYILVNEKMNKNDSELQNKSGEH